MTSGIPTVLLATIVGVTAGCHDDALDLPPLEYESRRARIGVADESDAPLCRADLEHIDDRVAFIEEHLHVHRDERIDVYLIDPEDGPCDADEAACYATKGSKDAIFTRWDHVDHELVHSTSREIDYPSLFWSEGVAELLSGGITRKDPRVALRPAFLQADDLTTYLTPAHFSRFLVETRGWDAYARIVRGASFEDVYGTSAEALTAAYERDAPYAYPPLDPCPYPELPQIDDGQWHETISIPGCDSPGVTQFEYVVNSVTSAPAVLRRLDLAAGTYAFDLSGIAGSLIVLGCMTEPLAELPAPGPSNGDVFNEYDYAAGTEFPAAGVQILELPAGAYRISVQALSLSAFTAELAVARLE